MIVDLHNNPRIDTDGATVIVGSGPAGLCLARELGRLGRRVVLLERGGRAAAAADGDDGGTAPRFRHAAGRRTGVGGTASAWHGQCVRLHDETLAPRAAVGGTGWPLDAADLRPWYDAAEQLLQVRGGRYDAERWKAFARLSPPAWDRSLLRHDFTEYAPRPDLGRRFARELERDPAVTVVIHAVAGGVELDGEAICGVRLVGSDGAVTVLPAREVVLAAGSIENARLLALSDADQVGLGTGREHTGRWLQDHPVIRTAEVLSASPDLQDLYTGLHRGRVHLFPKIRLAPGQQSASGLPDATASLTHDLVPSALDAVRRIRHREAGADVGAIARGLPGLGRAVWRRYARGLSSGLPVEHVWLDVWLEQPPRTDSRVTLGPNRDAYGLPTASVRWVVGEAERNSSRRLTALIGSELQRLGLGRLAPLPAATDDEAWQHTVADAFHPAGTTRMATEPTDGVVGPDLAVHGVPGLWVLGGSVFPTSGYSNPTLTIVALALRLAARLTVPAAIAQR